MEGICKDHFAELELPNEAVEITIDTYKGCTERIDIPAADQQFPSGGEISMNWLTRTSLRVDQCHNK